MVAGSATSVPPAISRPHWIWFSPMKSCSATVTVRTLRPGQHQREQVFVPGGDEQIDADRHHARHGQRQDDEPHRLQPRRAVDHRGLVELGGMPSM